MQFLRQPSELMSSGAPAQAQALVPANIITTVHVAADPSGDVDQARVQGLPMLGELLTRHPIELAKNPAQSEACGFDGAFGLVVFVL